MLFDFVAFRPQHVGSCFCSSSLQTHPTCDSQVTIAKAKSKIFNEKNRHIRLRHNIVPQLLETRVISLEFNWNQPYHEIHNSSLKFLFDQWTWFEVTLMWGGKSPTLSEFNIYCLIILKDVLLIGSDFDVHCWLID